MEIDEIVNSLTMQHMTMESTENEKISSATCIACVTSHVERALQEASPDDQIKTNFITSYRADVISEFLGGAKVITRCPHCSSFVRKLKRINSKIFVCKLSKKTKAAEKADTENSMDTVPAEPSKTPTSLDDLRFDSKEMSFLSPLAIQESLETFWKKNQEFVDCIYGKMAEGGNRLKSNCRMFFLELLAVPPTRFRPPSVMDGKMFEHPQNSYFMAILKINERIMAASKIEDKDQRMEVILSNWMQLQDQVNCLFDSSKSQQKGKLLPAGIKQILEKKEGLFRKHMMGKRVNFAARSVISPDPNIEASEIGIPMVFAKKLTYPEAVTHFNVKSLRNAVINGPHVHPGATHIQHEDGTLSSLETFSVEGRTALANQLLTPQTGKSDAHVPKKVLRHLRNGDVLLLNRQPTLHKPSMMGHKARILPGEKTIRMHYANCDSYNADFDGDEMNIHFHQNELARAEGYFIANTDNQYLVPTDGSPLRGLIQDHVVTGVMITMKDCFLSKEEYQQLVFGSLPDNGSRIQLVPPAILKPQRLWTGKQVISTIMCNLLRSLPPFNLACNSKIPSRMWPSSPEESVVIFDENELVMGVLDKAQFGATSFGLVHSIYELYGPAKASDLLSTLGRLFNKFLINAGFTCRMDDLILKPAAEEKRKALIKDGESLGAAVAAEFVQLPLSQISLKKGKLELEKVSRSDDSLRALDSAMKGKMNELTSKIIDVCLPHGLHILFPSNNMSMMTVSGAKGSNVNSSQISGLLGQQELEGRRVPVMVSGKTLPSFQKYDTSARAGGYITNRFLTGIKPQEYFFHCMAGREGLIDTAVKTSRSGYLQRCLVKHLEGLSVAYDQTVRDADGSVLQFLYGEDSLDVTKQIYLDKFDFAAKNYRPLLAKYQPADVLDKVDTEVALKYQRKSLKHPEKYDPALAKYNPGAYLGAISEKFSSALEEYIEKNPSNLIATKKNKNERLKHRLVPEKQFRALMWLKYMNSLVCPGEAVGVLAAQSVGEPSTQMTLNTFHFAGFGAKNVTLGIPRLREIIMTAAKTIKTPTMSIPFDASIPLDKCAAIGNQISKIVFKNVLESASVNETLLGGASAEASKTRKSAFSRERVYQVKLIFASQEELAKLGVSIDQVVSATENKFFKFLLSAIMKFLKKSSRKEKEDLLSSTAALNDFYEKAPNIADEDHTEDKVSKETEDDETEVKEIATYDKDEDEHESSDASSETEEEENMKSEAKDVSSDEMDIHANAKSIHANANSIHANANSIHASDKTSATSHDASPTAAEAPKNLRNCKFNASDLSYTFELAYPSSTSKILLSMILEQVSTRVVIREVPLISRAYAVPNKEASASSNQPSVDLITEGVNIQGIAECSLLASLSRLEPILDIKRLYSNDIHQMLLTFGVEAARSVIVAEIAAVFDVYGISVDKRHLFLIADYMTFEGDYKPLNRMGMQRAASPFAKMTFETTVSFLKNASLYGDYDTLDNPSARIVMGQPVRGGTGVFEVLQPLCS